MTQEIPASEDIETFLAITEAGTLNEASRVLNQPKSTLSRRLARLEGALGVRLFVRNRRRLALSETGVALLEPARNALSALRNLAHAADSVRAVPAGRLRVSIPLDLLGIHDLWLGFAEAFPNVALEMEPTNRHVDPVAERFDLALRAGKGRDESLIARPVGHYCLVGVASPAYVERWGTLEEPSQLRRHSCVLFREMGHRPGHPDRPEPPHRHIICPDETTALEGARRGLGIAILRSDVVQPDLDAGALVPVLDAYNPLQIPVYAVYPERAHLRAAVVAFIDYIAERLDSRMQRSPQDSASHRSTYESWPNPVGEKAR